VSPPEDLDVEFVRGQFPQLARGDLAYFDNAGGSLAPSSVVERMRAFMTECQVQPNGGYGPSAEATARLAEAHRLMAALINASPEEVVIGHSTTMNVYVLAQAFRPLLRPGDEIVVTNLDHEANNGAWRRLAEAGAVVKEWRVTPETAELEIETLERLLSERTRLVAFSHCSNIAGGFNDAAAIVRRVHEAGALACVDGVAFAPHRRVDVKALDVDFYLLSLYKVYGPHHALLYGKREHLMALRGQNHFFIGEDEVPLKLMVGGYDFEVVGAATGIMDYFDSLHRHHFPGSNAPLAQRLSEVYGLIARHEERIARPFADFLAAKRNVRVIGRPGADKGRRAPTFSFVVEGRDSAEIARRVDGHGVGIRHGDFYAYRLVRDLGLLARNGVVRASMLHYNNSDDVARLIRALDEAIG